MHGKRRGHFRTLTAAFIITAGVLVAEFIVALLTGSLALLADVGHMLADTAALGMALWAAAASSRKADASKSYGYGRAEVLVALLNAISLFFVAGYTSIEALGRIRHPPQVTGGGMLVMAIAGLAANAICAAILFHGARNNINARGAFFHVISDALVSIGVITAALIIVLTGWMLIDPIVSLAICMLIVAGGIRLFIESWHILMEGVPQGFDREKVKHSLCRIDGVVSVHDIHAWSISNDKPSATAHLVIKDDSSPQEVRKEAVRIFREIWGIKHVTLQIVRQSENDIYTDECPLAERSKRSSARRP